MSDVAAGRTCSKCLKNKPLDEFEFDRRKTMGKGYRCRPCKNLMARKAAWPSKTRSRPRRKRPRPRPRSETLMWRHASTAPKDGIYAVILEDDSWIIMGWSFGEWAEDAEPKFTLGPLPDCEI